MFCIFENNNIYDLRLHIIFLKRMEKDYFFSFDVYNPIMNECFMIFTVLPM